jgi:hypothetical protein
MFVTSLSEGCHGIGLATPEVHKPRAIQIIFTHTMEVPIGFERILRWRDYGAMAC